MPAQKTEKRAALQTENCAFFFIYFFSPLAFFYIILLYLLFLRRAADVARRFAAYAVQDGAEICR